MFKGIVILRVGILKCSVIVGIFRGTFILRVGIWKCSVIFIGMSKLIQMDNRAVIGVGLIGLYS